MKTTKRWKGNKRSLIERVKDRVFGDPMTSPEELFEVISKLEIQSNKLRYLSSKLQARDRTLFEKCVEASASKDQAHANLYATECLEIRRLVQVIVYSELALEQAVLRLQTVSELSNVVAVVAPIPDVVQDIRGKIADIVPSIASKLDEVNGMLGESIAGIGGAPTREFKVKSSEETTRILEEASKEAEQRVREKFPELPVPIKVPEANIPVALTTGGGTYNGSNSLEEQIYDYARSRNGRVSIPRMASELGISAKDVERVLLKLESEGRISIG